MCTFGIYHFHGRHFGLCNTPIRISCPFQQLRRTAALFIVADSDRKWPCEHYYLLCFWVAGFWLIRGELFDLECRTLQCLWASPPPLAQGRADKLPQWKAMELISKWVIYSLRTRPLKPNRQFFLPLNQVFEIFYCHVKCHVLQAAVSFLHWLKQQKKVRCTVLFTHYKTSSYLHHCIQKEAVFFRWWKVLLTQRKKKSEKKKAPSLLYSPAVHFNVLPEAFFLLPILSLFLFPLTPFPVHRLYVSPSLHLPVESLRCIKAMLSARSCQAPRPLLAGIQLSGSDRRKRGRKSLTSHMVPSSAGASPLRGQMANSYISSTLLISSSEIENISLFTLLHPKLGCGRLGAQLDSDLMLLCHVLKLLKMCECISVLG